MTDTDTAAKPVPATEGRRADSSLPLPSQNLSADSLFQRWRDMEAATGVSIAGISMEIDADRKLGFRRAAVAAHALAAMLDGIAAAMWPEDEGKERGFKVIAHNRDHDPPELLRYQFANLEVVQDWQTVPGMGHRSRLCLRPLQTPLIEAGPPLVEGEP